MSTAFVLSGGASLGAIQVGMLQALVERQIRPDLLVGTSAGALNAAFISGHGATPESIQSLGRLWSGLQARTLFSIDPVRMIAALAGRSSSLCSDRGLRNLLIENLTFEQLQDAPIPLTIVATQLVSGEEVSLRTGNALRAVLASCAIPGVFPAVEHGGQTLVDGGLADNTAVSQAILAGAETIYVLPTGYSCALPEPPRAPLGAAVHALSLLTHQRLVFDIARYSAEADLIVLPPPCPLEVSPINFARSKDLIERAYVAACDLLTYDDGRRSNPENSIAMHTHQRERD